MGMAIGERRAYVRLVAERVAAENEAVEELNERLRSR